MLPNLTDELRRHAEDCGAHLLGIASVASLAMAPAGYRPTDILKEAQSVVVMGLELLRAVVDTTPSREFAIHYDTVNQLLNELGYRVALYLARRGYRAVPIPASKPADLRTLRGDLSHKHVAVEAGMGEFGRNNLLLTPQFGPRVRLISLVTDAPLEAGIRREVGLCHPEKCDSACWKACPPQALFSGERRNDKQKCFSYRSRKGEELEFDFACALCMKVCPAGPTES